MSGTEDGKAFLKDWGAFMRRYGHHCRGELEIMSPRWSEKPDDILGQLRSYLLASDGADFSTRQKKASEERVDIVAECKRELRNPFKHLVFNFLLKRCQERSHFRENMKNQIVRQMNAIRKILLELDSRLIREDILHKENDIFFLRLDELEILVKSGVDSGLTERITERRAEYEKNLALNPPAVVIGRYDPESTAEEKIDQTVSTLKGVAVNPGVVTGPARVIHYAGSEQVQPGEILVAPFTDPGWTPYFLNAAALVIDMGGILSHGSIIAREFGIPAVVNVGPATKIIKTGQIIQVDGSRGTVKIIS